MSNSLTVSDLSIHGGDPRIRDLDLARRLGFAEDRAIRKIIGRNHIEIAMHGEVWDAASQTSAKGGRPGTEYHLNEAQALLVCMFSRTPNAADVRRQLIEVFRAYHAGKLVPAAQAPASIPDLTEIEARLARLERQAGHPPLLRREIHALALANVIEEFGYGTHQDGMHLGPSDLRLCVLHLRGGVPPAKAHPALRHVESLQAAIREAGRRGVARTALLKRFSHRLTAADTDAILGPLVKARIVAVRREQPHGGGRPKTVYRITGC